LSSAAAAEDRWLEDRTAILASGSTLLGSSDRSGLHLQLYGLGALLRLSPALDARLRLLALRAEGSSAEGEITPFGLGGEAGLYLSPWPALPLRPHAFGDLGILAFPAAPFLPGGSHYDFIVRGGLGVDVSASDRVTLGVAVFAAHISNGQGIGAHNPALDGFGGEIQLSWALARRRALPSAWPDEPAREPSYLPGVLAEGAVGLVDDALWGTARARVAQRLVEGLLILVDGEAGRLAGEPIGEIGGALVTHFDAVSLGVHGGYRRYVGLGTSVAALQIEGHATDEVSALAMAQRESSPFAGEVWRSGWGLRVYPFPSLLLEGGIGVDRLGDDEQRVEPFAGVDWALPLPIEDWQIALFAESQVQQVRIAGLRIGWGAGTTPRAFARERAWRRLR
jgi:hypothetical protein